MNFKVNINGTSRNQLQAQAQAIFAACTQTAKALREAYPHLRDYQTVADPQKAFSEDRMAFEKALAGLDAIKLLAHDYAETASKD